MRGERVQNEGQPSRDGKAFGNLAGRSERIKAREGFQYTKKGDAIMRPPWKTS